MTEVSISGTEFLLDGRPTYEGRTFEGHRIQGLLFNVRAVQATFDDANPATRHQWAYPDTGEWDPERNVAEFCAALPSWRDHGVLAFTVNFQGGGPLYVPEIYENYDNNGFTPDGELKPACADRMVRVLARADELGMVPIVSLFYWVFIGRMRDEEAIWRAAHNALEFLEGTGYRNLLIEIANEIEIVVKYTGCDPFRPEQQPRMVNELRQAHPGLLYSTSHMAFSVDPAKDSPPASLIETVDFVLLHGNSTRPPQLEAAIKALQAMPAYQQDPKPIVINEDSPAIPNLEVSWRNGVSWGYYDQGWEGQAEDPWEPYEPRPRKSDGPFEELNGFQTPPVNWAINTPFKRAFFNRVAEITGAPAD
ncbi:MAG: hypothetical protein JSV36_12275 [Anaerolineae bacterium]|nr:MAG: hypothetical protein JSV36_12275 [Anaerolineae bacterium]